MVNRHALQCRMRWLWAHFGRSLHVSQMTANWGRAAFQADEYILGIIANFVRKTSLFGHLACLFFWFLSLIQSFYSLLNSLLTGNYFQRSVR